MSKPTNDGGPVFPWTKSVGDKSMSEGGMSLRDYFAGQALAGSIAVTLPHIGAGITADEYAASLYEMADAMLTAREVKP